jgi:hypothetical protein
VLSHDQLADEVGQCIGEQTAAVVRHRQESAEVRADFAERRRHGKAAHHNRRLAEATQETSTSQPPIDAPEPAPVPRVMRTRGCIREEAAVPTHKDGQPAPARRAGRQCGYEGREALIAATRGLGAALTRLARDRDPVARQAGADIAASLADLVARAAIMADESSSRSQHAAARMAEELPELTRTLDTLQKQLGRRGIVLTGPPQA